MERRSKERRQSMFIRRLDGAYATMVLSSNYGQLLQQCRLMRLIDLRPPPEQLDPPLVHQGRRCRSDQESLLALGIEPTTSCFQACARNHSAKASPEVRLQLLTTIEYVPAFQHFVQHA